MITTRIGCKIFGGKSNFLKKIYLFLKIKKSDIRIQTSDDKEISII